MLYTFVSLGRWIENIAKGNYNCCVDVVLSYMSVESGEAAFYKRISNAIL